MLDYSVSGSHSPLVSGDFVARLANSIKNQIKRLTDIAVVLIKTHPANNKNIAW